MPIGTGAAGLRVTRTMSPVALLYRAEVTPGKLDLLNAWLPTRPWYTGPAEPALEKVSAFRFDDPDGAVGVETLLVRAADGGPVWQAPLTYRDAPLEGAEPWLLGTCEHTVLGTRWVYDAVGDPVYVTALATAVLLGGTEAREEVLVDGELRPRPPAMSVRGTGVDGATAPARPSTVSVTEGDPTLIDAGAFGLAVARVLGSSTLTGPALVAGEQVLAVVRHI